jgi:dTDP-4-amino-4,6-dideoxygalactose transaminase
MTDKLAIDGGTPVRTDMLPPWRVNYGYEELQEILEVFDSGAFCAVDPAATKVPSLEKAFAEYVGCEYALAFSSGTTAQHASMVAAGVGPGDEVIVPPLAFASTAYTVFMVGATPVFADVDDNSVNLDPVRAAEVITPKTKAIVPVHWFGYPAAMDEFMALAKEHNLAIIEDCAHGYGVSYKGRAAGTIGDMACWSLQETKVLTAGGEGGMFTTNDEYIAQMADSVRDHGKDKSAVAKEFTDYAVVRVGNNYRLAELLAAFALAQVRKAPKIQASRKECTEYMDAAILEIPGIKRPKPTADVTSMGHPYYQIRFDEEMFTADHHQIVASIKAEGIGCIAIGDVELSSKYPLFRENSPPANIPIAERISRELIIVPLYPEMGRSDMDDVVAGVSKVAKAYAK